MLELGQMFLRESEEGSSRRSGQLPLVSLSPVFTTPAPYLRTERKKERVLQHWSSGAPMEGLKSTLLAHFPNGYEDCMPQLTQ